MKTARLAVLSFLSCLSVGAAEKPLKLKDDQAHRLTALALRTALAENSLHRLELNYQSAKQRVLETLQAAQKEEAAAVSDVLRELKADGARCRVTTEMTVECPKEGAKEDDSVSAASARKLEPTGAKQ